MFVKRVNGKRNKTILQCDDFASSNMQLRYTVVQVVVENKKKYEQKGKSHHTDKDMNILCNITPLNAEEDNR